MTRDQYLATMEPHIEWSLKKHRGFRHMTEDDLRQEARIALLEVYENYRGNPDIKRIGTTAVANHLRDLHRQENAVSRGGGGARSERKRHAPAILISVDRRENGGNRDGRDDSFEPMVLALQTGPEQIERLIIREATENVIASLGHVEQRVARALIKGERIPAKFQAVNFASLQKTMRQI